MKAAIFIYALVLGMTLVGCKSGSGSSPQPPASTEAPSTTVDVSTTVPEPTTTIVVPAGCPQPTVGSVRCYDWGKCNGLFESTAAAVDFFKDDSSALCVDGNVVKGGFGPCAQCQAYRSAGSMKMASSLGKWKDVKMTVGTDKSKVLKVK